MDRLTDKPNWRKKVWDEEIVNKWREEAKIIPDIKWWNIATKGKGRFEEQPQEEDEIESYHPYQFHRCQLEGVVNDNTFDCSIKELRSKASYFDKTGIVVTMDACASVAKSDSLIPSELHDELCEASRKLIADQSHAPDWHPNSKDMVLDLVHPSMYPLIYGRSKVFREELVGIDDAVSKWSGKGDVIAKDKRTYDEERDEHNYRIGGSIHPKYWNDTYQWLPANLSFQDDGAVKFTSYINNLHPQKYGGMYHTIEKLIETALPLWDQCLNPDVLTNVDREHEDYAGGAENWIPSDPQELAHIKVNWDEVRLRDFPTRHADDDNELKWILLRKARMPEAEYKDVEHAPKEGTRLFDKFRDIGLQVIVKMVSIELTPEKPDFPAGGWHVEGQMNEHICATALYYLDSENVTTSSLSFRMQTDAYMTDEYSVGQQAYSWLEQIWGTELSYQGACLQNYGSVETHHGRLLAFPNVFQHRVSPFSLADKTRPGHRRFIALWLVDPHQRIISTANVPPQQQDWWLSSVSGDDMESRDTAPGQVPAEVLSLMEKMSLDSPSLAKEGKLPPELMEMAWEHFKTSEDKVLLSEEEAKEHRVKLMKMRTAFVDHSEEMWHKHTYSFCEH
ncbi:uncharacterized protein N0V89_001717 [Didymosphaeria variabile]|uniref:Uncharacterized protein n=1 Tax=Didymosphaeria variabile TaxID=1932322 RepID=A0A9W9CDP0_9PLEO|nr:uncharacterized protein N0V89_001717 [Didymosphaeria variabile]KAJ4357142.1 hypothetical protein N0V89_001717 [Didymosphaeria variabile]